MAMKIENTPFAVESLLAQRQAVEAAMVDAFVRHSIDNRGVLTSPRQGTAVAGQLFDLFYRFMAGHIGEAEVMAKAAEWAEQGIALVTTSAMLNALTMVVSADIRQSPSLGTFQTGLLEKVAGAREILQQRVQERSQSALQHALHHQLEQQIASHEAQKQQNETLNHILQLTAQLSQTVNEEELLTAAVNGFSQVMNISDVALYAFEVETGKWLWRSGTAVTPTNETTSQTHLTLLHQAQEKGGEAIQVYRPHQAQDGLRIAIVLRAGERMLGGMVVNNDQMSGQDSETYRIIVRTFAQNLAALWQNRFLITETQQRAKELEILYGRYLDSIWNTEHAALQAEFVDNEMRVSREAKILPAEQCFHIPLKIGDYPFGQIELPDTVILSPEDEEFVNVLVREMGSALNNAHFLQTARSYSNQLSVAAEVSRAATTILEQNMLIEEVVELIRSRFNFYYVGLFLLSEEENMAVLQAGTGEAGRLMVTAGHKLIIGGNSMIGTAVATGQARVEQDISQARFFARNPALPETRSELALPLRARGRTIGAITVQSKESGAFSPEGITVLQSLADQLAIAIENASLFAQTEWSLAESTRLYDTSRRINEATEPDEIYQALVDFAANSGVVDLAQIFSPDPASPDHLVSPVFWSKLGIKHNPEDRFSRDRFQATNRLETDQIFRIEDGPNDPTLDNYTRALFTNNGVRSATMVPIFSEQNWLGTLALDRVAPVPLTDQELQPFITLADQAAVILSNQQLLQQTETLYRIGRLLNQSITRDDALEIAVREVAAYIGAVQCRVVLYDHREDYGFVAAAHGVPAGMETIRLPLTGDFVYTHMRQQNAPMFMMEGNHQIPAEVIDQHVLSFGAKASLFIPASNQQEMMGFLAIDSRRGKRPFTPHNVIFAQTVVDQLVTQLENLKLLDEALQRAQGLITLNQIQTNISHYLDLNELAQAVYHQVGRLLDNTVFSLARYDADTRHYQFILYIVEGVQVQQSPRSLLPEEPLYRFLQQNQRLLADHTTPLTIAEARDLNRIPQSGLWIPLRREGKTAGLMSVQSYKPHAYQENDIELLRSIAIQTSLAIANAELFTRTQAHNEELMQLDQLKTQFLANMSHELRTPLNSIIGFSRVILKGIDGPITQEQQEDLTSIYSNGQHLLNLINEILDMAKIEAGKMTLSFEDVDLTQAAEAVRTTVRGLIDPDKIELIWEVSPNLPPVEADPIRIRQILLNLLSNAAKYTPEGHIHLKMEQEDSQVHILVKDTGIGIASEDFDKIFVAFEQADSSTTRAVGGTGLGLPITKWLVEMHQGQIYFESELNKGSTFHVILPIQLNHKEIQDLSLADPFP